MKTLVGNQKCFVFILVSLLIVVGVNVTYGDITPVSERTPQVRDAIVAAVPGVNSANDVTAAHLAAITYLALDNNKEIIALKAGDFDGLSSLTTLSLHDNYNNLTDLPEGVFSGLSSLATLYLNNNKLTSLPEGVFSGLTSLESLWLSSNSLTGLPEGVFSGLSSLTTLYLTHNDLTGLPEGVFSGLSSLESLWLYNNDLTSLPKGAFSSLSSLESLKLSYNQLTGLPKGVFSGVSSLTELDLSGNAVDPLPLTVSLQKVADGQFKVVAPTGAPFDIVVPLYVSGAGTISSGATSITIPAGSIESETLTVTRTTSNGVSVDIGALPGPPPNHSGYKLVKSRRKSTVIVFEDDQISIWSATMTVGKRTRTYENKYVWMDYGYIQGKAGSISDANFTYRGTTYTVKGINMFRSNTGYPTDIVKLSISPGLPGCDAQPLQLYVDFVWHPLASNNPDYNRNRDDFHLSSGKEFDWHVGDQFYVALRSIPTVPDAPILTGINEENQVTLSWDTPCDGGIDITGHEYRQRVRTGAFGPWIPIPNSGAGGVNVASYTFTNVNNPQENIFEVRAVNEIGASEASASVSPSDRTPQVAEAILNAVKLDYPSVTSFADITDSHLTGITTLYLGGRNITSLKSGDFDGLTSLGALRLNGNQLTSLPEGIFSGLTALSSLHFHNNQLSSLPDGIFEGLTALTTLELWGNSVDPLPLTVSLEQVGADGQFKAVAPAGAPFEIVLPLTVTNGSISGGATSITIPIGSVESDTLTVTRTAGTSDDITVDIGTVPGIPSNHSGYALVKSTDLPLTFTAPSETTTTLMAIKGTVTTEDGTPAEAGLQVTVTIGSDTKTAVSEAGGGYSVIFLSTQGVVATSGDTVTVHVLNPNTGGTTERTVQLSSAQIAAKQATIDLQFSTTTEYQLSVPTGISLIHVPLEVTAVDGATQTIESIADLYDALGGASTVSLLITLDPQAQRWVGYFGTGDRGSSADKVLTDDLGIIAVMIAPASVQLSGDALGTNGSSSITLHPGMNLVGVPLNDSRITRVSDLLALEGMNDNITLAIVSDNGEFKLTESAGDSGDIAVTGGQSFILVAQRAAPVEITGVGWSNVSEPAVAPSMALTGIEVTDITPVLAVTGSIGSPVGGASLPWPVGGASLPRLGVTDFSVTVKNLSTGKMDTAMTDDDGASYRFTFVDTETGRAAQVGDILELSAHSADPLIGVHPVRHTVTVEDVKRSRISLAELVAYEIPAKTALLLNYPNPFNPETWIPYRLAKDAFVTVTIYDQRGRVVRDIAVGHRIAAVYQSRSKAIYWDGRTEYGERVASGIYFYTLIAGDYSATRKMVILK